MNPLQNPKNHQFLPETPQFSLSPSLPERLLVFCCGPEKAKLFVAQGDRGVEAAGAPSGDVAGGASDEDEGGGGHGEGEGIMGREAEELALYHAGEHQGENDASGDADGDEEKNFAHDHPDDMAAAAPRHRPSRHTAR